MSPKVLGVFFALLLSCVSIAATPAMEPVPYYGVSRISINLTSDQYKQPYKKGKRNPPARPSDDAVLLRTMKVVLRLPENYRIHASALAGLRDDEFFSLFTSKKSFKSYISGIPYRSPITFTQHPRPPPCRVTRRDALCASSPTAA